MEIIYFGNFSFPIELWISDTGFWFREKHTIHYAPFSSQKGNIYIMEKEDYDWIQKVKGTFPLYIKPYIYLECRVGLYDSWYAYFMLQLNDNEIYSYYTCIRILFPFDLRSGMVKNLLNIMINHYNTKEIVNPFFYNKPLLDSLIKGRTATSFCFIK